MLSRICGDTDPTQEACPPVRIDKSCFTTVCTTPDPAGNVRYTALSRNIKTAWTYY